MEWILDEYAKTSSTYRQKKQPPHLTVLLLHDKLSCQHDIIHDDSRYTKIRTPVKRSIILLCCKRVLVTATKFSRRLHESSFEQLCGIDLLSPRFKFRTIGFSLSLLRIKFSIRSVLNHLK